MKENDFVCGPILYIYILYNKKYTIFLRKRRLVCVL